MRWPALALAATLGATWAWDVASAASRSASAAPGAKAIVVSKPAFRPPLGAFTASAGPRLHLISATPRQPGPTFPDHAFVVETGDVPQTFQHERVTRAFAQPGTTFFVYGTALLAAFGPHGRLK